MSVISRTYGSGDQYYLQEALSAYSDEAYTTARKISGTGIVGSNPLIDTGTESFIGQVRWMKPLNPVINVASIASGAADGSFTTYTSEYLRYIKTVRTHGASKVNLEQLVTQVDGLAKVGRDLGETRSQDEHNALMGVLKGIALTEVLIGAGYGNNVTGKGGQTWTNDPSDAGYGFYVDLGNISPVNKAGFAADGTTANYAYMGAVRAENFLNAIGKAFKDYEPEYAYLVTSPEVYASFRSANLVDEIGVVDGNITFNTIFNGKFRIIQTRATQGLTSTDITLLNTMTNAAANTNALTIKGTKTSFIVLPGSIALQHLAVPDQVEIYRNANTYKGGGSTNIWYRWGYVLAPVGYDWNGDQNKFPADDEYAAILQGTTPKPLSGTSLGGATVTALVATDFTTNNVISGASRLQGTWTRKALTTLSLGILPIFHS